MRVVKFPAAIAVSTMLPVAAGSSVISSSVVSSVVISVVMVVSSVVVASSAVSSVPHAPMNTASPIAPVTAIVRFMSNLSSWVGGNPSVGGCSRQM